MENPEDRDDDEAALFAAANEEEDESEGDESEGDESEGDESEGDESEGDESEGDDEAEGESDEDESEGEDGEEDESDEDAEAEEDEAEEDEDAEDEEDEDADAGGGDGDGGDGDGGGDGDDGDDDGSDDDDDDDDGGELAELDDDEVFAGADDYDDATEEDFEDDDGTWDDGAYDEAAEHIFGQEPYYGESPEERYLELGWEPLPEAETQRFAAVIDRVIPGVSRTTRFWNDGGTVKAQGFLPLKALREAKKKLTNVDFSAVHATVPRKAGKRKPGKLPKVVDKIDAREVVDLRKYCSPIGDQGDSSRCSAFAWTHALEMALRRGSNKKVRLSPSYTMWQIQGVQGDQDDFAYAASGGEGTQDGPEVAMPLVKKGCCRQELWSDDEEEPSADLSKLAADARSYRLPAKLVTIRLSEVKKVLSSGNPVHLGMNTGEGFQAIGRDGLFNSAEEPSGQHGGHAMLIVGYKGNHFIVKNSWGTEWGDKGYCYIPKKVLQASDSSFVAVLLKEPK